MKKGELGTAPLLLSPTRNTIVPRDHASRDVVLKVSSPEETAAPTVQPMKRISRIIVPDILPDQSAGLKSSSFVLQDIKIEEKNSLRFLEEKSSSRSSSFRDEKTCGVAEERTKEVGKFLRVNSNVLEHLHLNHVWLKECRVLEALTVELFLHTSGYVFHRRMKWKELQKVTSQTVLRNARFYHNENSESRQPESLRLSDDSDIMSSGGLDGSGRIIGKSGSQIDVSSK
ncbi:hypothetical protein ACHWQZ_G001981 [Mnemiopsis leidyi]